eukprot:764867-Hanusia_phi.AAC.15
MVGLPVKIEHEGVSVGRVVSAFKDGEGRLNCVMEIERDEVEGAIAQQWVNDNTASELSLGYVVDINQSRPGEAGGQLKAGKKKILEVSLVRKGARDGCQIYSHARKALANPGPPLDGRDPLKEWKEAFGI